MKFNPNCRALLWTRALIVVALAGVGQTNGEPAPEGGQQQFQTAEQFFKHLRSQDVCGTIYTSKLHGYEIKEYKVETKDRYTLRLHRLIHPADFATQGPPLRKKKPYLLVHGLIGTSASFVTNVAEDYYSPRQCFGIKSAIYDILEHRSSEYARDWRSTADALRKTDAEAPVDKYAKVWRPLAAVEDIDFDGDSLLFGKAFRQAHRKFELPKEALQQVSSSLAFTLSNLGYDVWLVNLRGNHYSRGYNGRLSAEKDAEYWNFNVDTLVREDLMASVNFVKSQVQCAEPMGLAAYSYSSMAVLELLAKYPAYQESLQPVVLMAPTLMTASASKSKLRLFVKAVSRLLISHNGPFPALGRSRDERLEKLLCSMPIASKLCSLFETIMHGRAKKVGSVKGLLFSDREATLLRRDHECGQTSKAVLHQIVANLNQGNILPMYKPFERAREMELRGQTTRRSVILVHAESDEISTMEEVRKVRDSALAMLALVDIVIKEPNFSHTDFLFDRRNQYLVNAEVARAVALFDFLLYQKPANAPQTQLPGSSTAVRRRPPGPPPPPNNRNSPPPRRPN